MHGCHANRPLPSFNHVLWFDVAADFHQTRDGGRDDDVLSNLAKSKGALFQSILVCGLMLDQIAVIRALVMKQRKSWMQERDL